jgi:hypothetical protein
MSLDQRVQDPEMIMPCQEIEPEVDSDLVAEIAAHLANELHRDIPVAVRIKTFWAYAEAIRGAAPHEQIKQAFLVLAEQSGLISDLGRHGREDVHHVLDWALRGRMRKHFAASGC